MKYTQSIRFKFDSQKIKTTSLIILIFLLLITNDNSINAQILLTDTSGIPDSSAILELKSSSKGLLLPRMTMNQRDKIQDPTSGLIIYCNDCHEMQFYNDTAWTNMLGLPANPGFVCGDTLEYAGESYATVLMIGGDFNPQCWFSENLNIGTMISEANAMTDNNIIEKYCYDDDPANCEIYGGLYQWDEMMKYSTTEEAQGLCPVDWHLASEKEWQRLEIQLGIGADLEDIGLRGSNEGSKLAGNEPLWLDGNLDQTIGFGTTGFMALPGDKKNGFNIFKEAFFWTSSESNATNAWLRNLRFSEFGIYRNEFDKANGYSVRCLQD